jgi:hypothetical protein
MSDDVVRDYLLDEHNERLLALEEVVFAKQDKPSNAALHDLLHQLRVEADSLGSSSKQPDNVVIYHRGYLYGLNFAIKRCRMALGIFED